MLLYGADITVRDWVSFQLYKSPDKYDDNCSAIGIIKNNKLIAGVVYSDYQPTISIDMSIASVDKTWCNRHNLKALFKYPFIDLSVKRVQALCSANEGKTMKFLEKLGFTQEGLHREAHYAGGDTASFGMLKSECRWVQHG